MKIVLNKIVSEIRSQEDKISSKMMQTADEAYQLILFLKEMLCAIKAEILQDGFSSTQEEIDFFKKIKPQVLGKLIYYNQRFRIETACPCPVNNGKMYYNYLESQFKILNAEYEEGICNEDFYRYYRAGRTDRDHNYFRLGQINYYEGLNSDVFEIDVNFSTYYDIKVAHIIAYELLYTYLFTKINLEANPDVLRGGDTNKDISWTNSQNALIELIYALHASNSISHGNMGIRKMASIFQIVFRIPLHDLHHAFHRMKTRSGSRTIFLDQLKQALEEYMDKNKDL